MGANKLRTPSTIEKEIAAVQARREVLAGDESRAHVALRAAREKLITGAGDVSPVTSAQSTATALTAAVAAVDARLSELRAELAEARAGEQAAATRARAAELRQQREALQAEWNAQHAAADAALSQTVASLHDIGQRAADASRELARLGPAGAPVKDRGLVTPQLEFGEAIYAALQHAHNEADRQRLKAASRAATERERLRAAAQQKAA
jgi:chromosome segregation ATPase